VQSRRHKVVRDEKSRSANPPRRTRRGNFGDHRSRELIHAAFRSPCSQYVGTLKNSLC
jgi:hypothetical protein